MDLQVQLDQAQKHLMQRYLNAIFRSLSKPVEIVLRDGRKADGIFDGFLPQTSTFQIKNFCIFQEENFEQKIHLKLSQIRFICVKNNSIQKHTNVSLNESTVQPKNKPTLKECLLPKQNQKYLDDEYDFSKQLHPHPPKKFIFIIINWGGGI